MSASLQTSNTQLSAQQKAEKEARVSRILSTTTVLAEWAQSVISTIPTASDDHILMIAGEAQKLERAAFMVRGACAAEMKKRISERVALRPELRGDEQNQVGKQLSAMATEIGVSPKTLDEDARIYATFAPAFRVDTERLDREHYRIALAAPDPQAAIEMAREKKSDRTYTTRDFRDDVKELQEGKPVQQVTEKRWLHVPLTTDAGVALDKLCAHRDKSPSELISQVLCDALYWHEQKGKR